MKPSHDGLALAPGDRAVLDKIMSRLTLDENGCWLWSGRHSVTGHGQAWIDGRTRMAHRVVYEFLVGPIPDGYDAHHECQQPACCNPEHLRPLPHGEHTRISVAARELKTHCKNGHEFAPENTRLTKEGWRTCRECQLERGREWNRRNLAKRREGLRQWREENRDHHLAYKRAWNKRAYWARKEEAA